MACFAGKQGLWLQKCAALTKMCSSDRQSLCNELFRVIFEYSLVLPIVHKFSASVDTWLGPPSFAGHDSGMLLDSEGWTVPP